MQPIEYNKKNADIVKAFCSKENYAQNYQMISVTAAGKPVDLPKDPQKYDIYTNEEGMYELLFPSQQPKVKYFRRHCFNVLLPHVRQEFSNTSHAMEIEDLTSRVQALEVHQQAIDKKDAAIVLLNDDLQDREYENVGLQGEIRAKDQQIDVWQRRYVGHLSEEDKNNGISIIAKNIEEAEYPSISICGQHGYRRHKAKVLLTRNQGSTLFADGDTPNAIVTYNFWQEHRLIVVDPNRPGYFRLDMLN